MVNVASLKKKAVDLEAKKQFAKAIAVYCEVLDAYDTGDHANVEIALYNRVGDLLMRQGNVPDAMTLFERAVDLYTEGGFFNNAIALCNKVLRSSPGRVSIYYKLGKISAKKGFRGEAKQNYLEYADRMQKSGQMDEAFRALAEFADFVPDQDDVRLMLADQLTKAGRNTQALAQLQVLHQRYSAEGRGAELQVTVERMQTIDPHFVVTGAELTSVARKRADDLIFIDLDAPPTAPKSAAGTTLGLEPTAFGTDTDIQAEPEPMAPQEFAAIDLSAIVEAPSEPRPVKSDLVFHGDLPLLDMGDEAPTDGMLVNAGAPEVVEEAPPVRRLSSVLAANSVLTLRVKVADDPENWALRRQLGEALLEGGEKDEGVQELEVALQGLDKANDVENASSIVDVIVRVNPSSVRFHQKRVEYAFRASDKPRAAEAYLALADALLRDGQSERARAVYQRVLEITPGDARAHAALEMFLPAAAATPEKAVPAAVDGDDIALGDWLRNEDAPKSTRIVVEEQVPVGDGQADFADMLKKFKQGVAENVQAEDYASHYDLGVAFKETGLIDEAIAEFQQALRGTQHKARAFEALGQCFIEKQQLPVATTVLTRALNENIADEQLIGVLYLLGYIHEAINKPAEAKGYYERVFAVDIRFRDIRDRLNAVDKAIT